LLGLLGALLGLEKDMPQVTLKDAHLAVAGSIPKTHWHSANLRKDPPASLPYTIRSTDRGTSGDEKNTIITQEWLISPCYRVWVNLPNPYHSELLERIMYRKWHFSPCLGLSEMSAEINFLDKCLAVSLPDGKHDINSALRRNAGSIDLEIACERGLAIHMLRMPRNVSYERQFQHEAYYVEREDRAIPMTTPQSWQVGENKVVFL
jgi:CRISPR-associated protein Cas5h